MNDFLVFSAEDMRRRGWDELDIVLITGDLYIDHPALGTSLVGRLLEKHGYRVGIISRPDAGNPDDFKIFGRPRLFFGVSSGSVDSMIANYTANKKPRREAVLPDRALIKYTNCVKQAYKGVTVVLGGIEASMRRLAHYDYWSDKVRRSVLLDAKADVLIYGMAEKSIIEVAEAIKNKQPFDGIRGTVVLSAESVEGAIDLPSFEEVSSDKGSFTKAFLDIYCNQDPFTAEILVQKHARRYVIHNPPQYPLTTEELDSVYDMEFHRMRHPSYGKREMKEEAMIANSVTSHRGCPGQCNFCSLFFHQGRIVQSRSRGSVLKECTALTKSLLFHGTITDVGGPSANLYMAECTKWKDKGACKDKQCLMPKRCGSLGLGYKKQMDLLSAIRKLPGVNHVFLSSGLRYDLLTEDDDQQYLEYICRNNISGQMKVAPEHMSDKTLKYMNKPLSKVYLKFVDRFKKVLRAAGKRLFLVNYFIMAHPGSTLDDASILADYLKKQGYTPEQVQDYLPLPMTVSSVMYYTGKDPFTGSRLHIIRSPKDRARYRGMIQSR